MAIASSLGEPRLRISFVHFSAAVSMTKSKSEPMKVRVDKVHYETFEDEYYTIMAVIAPVGAGLGGERLPGALRVSSGRRKKPYRRVKSVSGAIAAFYAILWEM